MEHKSHVTTDSRVCSSLCAFKLSRRVKAEPQSSQTNFFSFLCPAMCRLRSALLTNALSHSVHLCRLSPEEKIQHNILTSSKCKLINLEKLMSTTAHALMKPPNTTTKGIEDYIKVIWFSPIWYLMCDLIQPLVLNSFPQNSHLYCLTSAWIALWMVNSPAVLKPFWHSWKEYMYNTW